MSLPFALAVAGAVAIVGGVTAVMVVAFCAGCLSLSSSPAFCPARQVNKKRPLKVPFFGTSSGRY